MAAAGRLHRGGSGARQPCDVADVPASVARLHPLPRLSSRPCCLGERRGLGLPGGAAAPHTPHPGLLRRRHRRRAGAASGCAQHPACTAPRPTPPPLHRYPPCVALPALPPHAARVLQTRGRQRRLQQAGVPAARRRWRFRPPASSVPPRPALPTPTRPCFLRSVSGLVSLEELSLEGCEQVTSVGLNSLAGLTRMRRLSLQTCHAVGWVGTQGVGVGAR